MRHVSAPDTPELSVVMPCLNEADTLAICIGKVHKVTAETDIAAEIIVTDNGSTDGSQRIAEEAGARVVNVAQRGYGHALMGGIAAARGDVILMADADDSYDFLELEPFVRALRDGAEFVQGCRLPAGGGRVLPGAMPPLHRWLGNPLLSALVRLMFGAPVNDVYCGMRSFTRELYDRLDMRCGGMEFATEMVIKATFAGARITEAPITLHPDGRVAHAPHLKTFRDGWRTVRLFLLLSPRWLFLVPGLALLLLGLLGYAAALPALSLYGATLDAHTLLVASLALLLGHQAILFAIFTKTFAETEGLLPPDPRLKRFNEIFNLEMGLAVSAMAIVLGLGLLSYAVLEWRASGFGYLDYAHTMRRVIPGVTLIALGAQTVLSSFFVSILGMARR